MSTLIRDALIIVAVSVVGVKFIQSRSEVPPPLPAEAAPRQATPQATAPAPRAQTTSGGSVTLYKTRGQFHTDGYVNSSPVSFLVDTGASVVALTAEDARMAGLDPARLDYSVTVSTANGTTRAAPVTLDALSIGPITERNVRAVVIETGLDRSLLGMTFLERLQSFEARADTLTLRL